MSEKLGHRTAELQFHLFESYPTEKQHRRHLATSQTPATGGQTSLNPSKRESSIPTCMSYLNTMQFRNECFPHLPCDVRTCKKPRYFTRDNSESFACILQQTSKDTAIELGKLTRLVFLHHSAMTRRTCIHPFHSSVWSRFKGAPLVLVTGRLFHMNAAVSRNMKNIRKSRLYVCHTKPHPKHSL